jgi:hypothetical protein
MILLASVAGALLFVTHSRAGQRPRSLSGAPPDGLRWRWDHRHHQAQIPALAEPRLGRSGSPLATFVLVSAFFTGTTRAELEPVRIGIDCCRSGIMRTVGYRGRGSI